MIIRRTANDNQQKQKKGQKKQKKKQHKKSPLHLNRMLTLTGTFLQLNFVKPHALWSNAEQLRGETALKVLFKVQMALTRERA